MLSESSKKLALLYSCPLDIVQLEAPAYHVINVVRELGMLGYPIDLIHQGCKRDGIDDINQIALALNRNTKLGRLRSDLGYFLGVLKQLRNKKYDWVYHRLEKWSVLPILLFRAFRIPVVLEFNTDVHAELRSLDKSWLFRKLYGLSERLQVSLATQIIVVSAGIEQSLLGKHPSIANRISTIENGTDINTFFPMDRTEACDELGLNPEHRYVTFAGSLQKWQGVETIVECAHLVNNEVSNVKFLIIGDGSCFKNIRDLIRSKNLESEILMLGWRDNTELAKYLAASDICLAPYSRLAALDSMVQNGGLRNDYSTSLMKCSPLKIFTYMAMGKPVIASDFADGGHRLKEWKTGLSHIPNDEKQLASAIVTLLTNRKLAKVLGENGLIRVRDNHTWSSVAKEIERICFSKSLIGR